MIDETRAPATAEWARKNAKLLRDNPRLRDLAEELAMVEANGLDLKAKATIGENVLRRLQKMQPDDPLQSLMTPIDMRKRLAAMRAEVNDAVQAIEEIR